MRKFLTATTIATLAIGVTPTFAGSDAAVGAPASSSVTVTSVTIVVTAGGGASVNGAPINVNSLPPAAQTAISQVAATGGGSLSTTSPAIIALLASYF